MFGTLLILGMATDAFTPASAADATTLAIHASIALAAHRQRGHWQEAVASRHVIGQAKGIGDAATKTDRTTSLQQPAARLATPQHQTSSGCRNPLPHR